MNKKMVALIVALILLIVANAQAYTAFQSRAVLTAADGDENIVAVVDAEMSLEQRSAAEIASAAEYESEFPALIDLGEFVITHYCACEVCSGKWGNMTASGKTAQEGRTIAVDPKVIPLGSKVVIGGWEFTAEDTGGAIKGNRIDIYVGDHKEALSLGKYKTEVKQVRE